MGVQFHLDGGEELHRGCFGLILSGLAEGNMWLDDEEEEGKFIPDTITFTGATGSIGYGVAGKSSVKEWNEFYSDIYPTMEGVSEILSLDELLKAGRKKHVTMNVAAEFGKDRTFLPMVLHLIRLPYSAPWVARMYKEIKDKWPEISPVDCFQLACAVRPTLPDDKDEKLLLNFHPSMSTTNRDANRPFNAITDVRLGQKEIKPCPREESFSVTQFSVKGGSSDTYHGNLARVGLVPEASKWHKWAKIVAKKLTPEQMGAAKGRSTRSWGGALEEYIIAQYFGSRMGLGQYQMGKYSHTCQQIIEEVLDIFGGKKK